MQKYVLLSTATRENARSGIRYTRYASECPAWRGREAARGLFLYCPINCFLGLTKLFSGIAFSMVSQFATQGDDISGNSDRALPLS